MKLGYNTNGLAHHRLTDAISLLADEGYASVALTLDAGALDPFDEPFLLQVQAEAVRELLDRHQMTCVVETGARYLLNPRKKHDPTLLDPNPVRRHVRSDFLGRAIDLAGPIGAGVVSIWSGKAPDEPGEEVLMERLAEALKPVLDHAADRKVVIGFEPEPGMFIDTFARFKTLDARLNHPAFQLTVDIGHVHCLESGPISGYLHEWGPRIVNIHIEDMVVGVHEHLMFGEGTIDFADVFAGLRDSGFQGGLNVELSRHSHMAVEAVRQTAAFLKPYLAEGR